MRSIIDRNPGNLGETLIYISRINIIWKIFMLIATVIVFICNSECREVGLILLAFGIFLFQIYFLVKSIKRIDEIQFRINPKGIQYRNLILVPWSNIENERVVTEYVNSENSNDYFIYYIIDSGQVMKFDLAKLSTEISELSITLRIHRNRYKRENNIS